MSMTNPTDYFSQSPRTDAHEVVPFMARSGLPISGWGEYDSIELHGEGGMGVVYRAHHKRLNRLEAIKLLRGGIFASSRSVELFRFEAEATAALEHPHIVPVYTVG